MKARAVLPSSEEGRLGLQRRLDQRRFRRHRVDYFDYLAALLTGGSGARTLKDVFRQDALRYGSASFKGRLAHRWLSAYERAGGDLYATWAAYVPRGELALIRAAQSLGNEALIKTLADLACVLRLLQDATRLLTGILWPAALALLVALLVSIAVPWFTVPRLLDVFAFLPPDYYGSTTRSLLSFSSWVKAHAAWLAVCGCGLVGLIVWSLPNATGRLRKRLDRWLWWDVYRNVMALRFLSFLIVALGNDAQASTQLRNALLRQRGGAAPWLSSHIDRMLSRIDEGILGPATLDTGLFAPEQFWFLSDMVMARGLRTGLGLARDRLRAQVLGAVARQAHITRWLFLLSCVAFVLGLALWHYAVIDDMRRALTLYFSMA